MQNNVDVQQNATKTAGNHLEKQHKSGGIGKAANIPAVAFEHAIYTAALY